MSKPLYGCSNPSCAEEVSYPADMLRVYEGKPYCDCCWDDAPLAYAPGVDPDDEDAEPLYWHDLEPFVPEHEKRIAELEAVMQDAKEVIERQRDERLKLEAENALEKKRNRELEAENVSFARECNLVADEKKELKEENQRLREAAYRVLYVLLPGKVVHMGHEHVRYSATYSVVGWNPILSLAALLGGGE